MHKSWELGARAAWATLLGTALLLAGSVAAAAAEWQTYLAETFDGAETMFYSGQAGEAFYSVDNGRYLIDGLGTGSDSLSALTDGMYYYYAEASCEMLESSAGDLAFCGMVFHYNKKTANKLSYYVFYVYGDGYYGAKRVIGDQVEIVLPLTRTTELIPARPNTLGVDAQGTRFDLYINGKYVDGFTDVRIDGGGFGFYISKHTKAAFDDFVVKIEQRGGLQPSAEPNSVEGAIEPEAAQDDFGQYQFPDIPRDPERPVYPWEVGVDKSQKAKRQRLEREREDAGGEETAPGTEQEAKVTPGEPGGVPSEHGKLEPGEAAPGEPEDAGDEAPPPDDESAGGDQASEATDVKLISQPPAAALPAAQPDTELMLPQGEDLLIPDPLPAAPEAPQTPATTAVRPPTAAPDAAAGNPGGELQLPDLDTAMQETAAPLELVPADAAETEEATPASSAEIEPETVPEPQPEALPPVPPSSTSQVGQTGGPQAQPSAAQAPATAQAATNASLNRMRSRSGDWEDVNSDADVVEEQPAAAPASAQPADQTEEAAAGTPPAESGTQRIVSETAEPATQPPDPPPPADSTAPAEIPLYPETAPADPAAVPLPQDDDGGAELSFAGLPPELGAPEQLPDTTGEELPPDTPAAPAAAAAEPLALLPPPEAVSMFGVPESQLTVVADDFTQPRWPVSESGASTYRYFGAAYEINNLAAETMAISYQDAQLVDVELALDAEYLDGQSYVGYGVAARFGVVNGVVSYYGFFISQSGEFLLLKVLNGEEVVLKDWAASSLLAPAKPSRLKLEVQGRVLRAYINDELVATLEDGDIAAGGYALLVGPGCAARFDNLNLRGVSLSALAAAGTAGS